MKTFLIIIALCIAGGVYLITSYSKLGDAYVQSVIADEGTPDAMKEAGDKDDKAFVVKYQPLLEKRWRVGIAARILDMDYYLVLSKDTLDRYTDTPLQTDPIYGKFLYYRAAELQERIKPPQEAFNLFKRYLVLFPNAEETKMAQAAVNHLVIQYGMQ